MTISPFSPAGLEPHSHDWLCTSREKEVSRDIFGAASTTVPLRIHAEKNQKPHKRWTMQQEQPGSRARVTPCQHKIGPQNWPLIQKNWRVRNRPPLVRDDKIGVRTTTPTMGKKKLVRNGRGQHDPTRAAARSRYWYTEYTIENIAISSFCGSLCACPPKGPTPFALQKQIAPLPPKKRSK